MRKQELRKRLAQMNRLHLKRADEAPSAVAAPPPDLRVIRAPASARPTLSDGPVSFESLVPGRVVQGGDGGTFWLIERRLSEIAPETEPFLRRYKELLTSQAIILSPGSRRDLARFVECDPCRSLYLDIETTGLSGQPLFLIGVMAFDGHDFVIRQYFARNYAEEGHLLAAFADALAQYDLLATFNGRSFDLPYMRDRYAVNRLSWQLPPHHFDLLHESRRRWSRSLPNCKLVTLEQFICRRCRVDDIPGAEIPAAYHEFVHTQDASKMHYVIHHNALDLLTMAELALFMLTGRKDWE